MKDLKENNIILQKKIINEVEAALLKNNISFVKKELGGDYLFIIQVNNIEKFSIEICYEYTEFYENKVNLWYHVSDEFYVKKVLDTFHNLLGM